MKTRSTMKTMLDRSQAIKEIFGIGRRWIAFGCFMILLSILGTNISIAQTWNAAYTINGPSTNNDGIKGVCSDTAGNYYFIGGFSGGPTDFNPGAGTWNLTSSATSPFPNVFVSKYNSAGVFQWAITVASPGSTIVSSAQNGIVADGSNVYIAVNFTGTLTVGATVVTSSPLTTQDMAVFKLNTSDGSVVWGQKFGGTNSDAVNGICLDTAGDVYINGNFTTSSTIGGTNITATGGSGNDMFIAKLNKSNGNVIWLNSGGATATSETNLTYSAVAYSPYYNKLVYVGSMGGATGTYGSISVPSLGSGDIIVAELDPATGTFTNVIGMGSSGNDAGSGAVYDQATHDIFVGGNYAASFTLPGTSTALPQAGIGGAMMLARYSIGSHNFVWGAADSLSAGTVTTNQYRTICTNNVGGIFAAGLATGTINAGGNIYTASGTNDMILSRYNASSGGLEGINLYGGTALDNLQGMVVDSLGRVAIGGASSSPTITLGSITLNPPDYDMVWGFMSVPSVKTAPLSIVTATSIAAGGNALATGGNAITARGIVYATTANPTIATGTNVTLGSGTGSFSQTVTGLTAGQTYHVRAYITTATGTYYGIDQVITMASSNTAPTFVSGTNTLSACQNGNAIDIKYLLHVSDVDASQTETWTQQSAPSHGTLSFTSATASSGSADITPGGNITYQPTAGYSGTDVFTIRVSDGSATANFTITATISPLTSSGSSTSLTCNANSSGTATAIPSGGAGGYTYVWSPGGSTLATATGLAAGNYTCTISDVAGCVKTQTVTVTQPSALISSTFKTNIACNGASTGLCGVNPSGGTAGYTYVWTPGGATTNSITSIPAGSYSCTITDAHLCVLTKTFTVTQPTAITSTVTAQSNVTTAGGSDGSATISASGGAGGYTYSWLPSGGTTASISGRSAGTYTCTIRDVNSCNHIQTVTLTEPVVTNITPTYTLTSPQAITLCQNASATDLKSLLHVSDADASQTETWTQQFGPSHGTLTITSATASSGSTDITPGGTITYQPFAGYAGTDNFVVRVSDGTSTADMSINVTVNSGPSIFGNSPIDLCSGGSVTIAPNASETSTFTWGVSSNTSGVTGASSGSGTTFTHTLTNPGNASDALLVYTVVPTSTATGCVGSSANYNVTVHPLPLVTNSASISVCSGNTLSLPLTASTSTNFAWTLGTITGGITGATTGTSPTIFQTLTNPSSAVAGSVAYIVTPTSIWSCAGPATTLTVKVNPKPTLTSGTSFSICSGATTSIGLTASAPSTFSWTAGGGVSGVSGGSGTDINQTLSTFDHFNAGTATYQVTITSDTGACANLPTNVTVNVNPTPISTTLAPTAICSGTTTSIALSGSVASTFTWTVSSNTGSVTGTADGSGNSINQTLVNPSNSVTATVIYSAIPTSVTGLCLGTSFTVSQSINPKPVLANSSSISICSGAFLNVPFTASTPSSFSYSPVSVTGGITGAGSSSGTSVLTQTLTNPGNVAAGYVTYSVTPTAFTGTCVGNTGTITVKVNPKPDLTSSALRMQCSGTPTDIDLTASTPSTITWTVSSSGGMTGAASGSGNNIAQTLVNPNAETQGYVQYSIVVTSDTGGCVRDLIYIADTVNPASPITVTANPSVTAGTTSADLNYTVPVAGSTPLTYDIVYSAAAHTAGFTDVSNGLLVHGFPSAPVSLVIPATAPGAVYDATIVAKNSYGCSTIPPTAFTVTVENDIPTFLNGSTDTIPATICQNANGININSYLHAKDLNVGQTLTWSLYAIPDRCGELVFTGTNTAPAGGTDIAPGGQITYIPSVAFTGTERFVVKVSDGTDFSLINITVNVSAVTGTVVSATNVSCNGGSNGAATVSVSNMMSAVSYNWTPGNPVGDGTVSVSGLTAGVYTVSASDTSGCAIDFPVTITEPTSVASSVSAQTNVLCKSSSTGVATVTASGGTPAYTYAWTPSGGSLATATGLAAGSYTCTITDANSCIKKQTVTITEPATQLSVGGSPATGVTCYGDHNGSATVTPNGGVTPYTYSWAPSGGSLATATGLGGGSYTCTVTDNNGCSVGRLFFVSEPSPILAFVSSQTNVSCHGGSNGSVAMNIANGVAPLTYAWSPTGGATQTGTGLSAGTYTLTVTDANFCVGTKTVTVTEPTTLTASITATTNVSCYSGSNGSATVTAGGGSPSYSYLWSPGAATGATATGLAAGNYTVTVTDNKSCTQTAVANITEPTVLTASISATTNVSCNGGNNGTATVNAGGGTPGYTYSWSPVGGTGVTGTGLAAGNYTVTVTDSKSCTQATVATITEPAAITASITATTNVSCNSGNDGAATVTAVGGTGTLTYQWSPVGGTLAAATGLIAGSYSVTVKDANLCAIIKTVTVTQPTAITSSVSSKTNVDCNGNATGSATITASGGTGILNYSWAPSGGSLATATGLTAGIYTCTISDENLCTHIQTVTITQPTALTTSISGHTDVTCNGGSNGTATVLPAGGTIPYSYSWSPIGGSGATGTGFSVGLYTCTVTDNNGCSHDQVAAILEPALPVATIAGTTAICKDENADVIINGPSGTNVAYTINGGSALHALMDVNGADTINTGSLTSTATYSLVSITEGSCTYPSTGSAVVTVKPFPSVDVTADQSICNGSVTTPVIFNGSVPGTLFTWSNNNTTTGIPANGTDSITTLTLTNTTTDRIFSRIIVTPSANGCTGINDTFEIVSEPTPMLSSTLTALPVCNNTLFSYTPTSATAGTTFTWSRALVAGISNTANSGSNDPGETLINTTADPVVVTYVYTLTANNCSNTQNVTVTVQPSPRLSSTLSPAAICDSTVYSYTPASATSGTSFSWTRIADESFYNASANGNDNPNEVLYLSGAVSQYAYYVYTLTANSCSDTQHLAVQVNPVPSLSTTLNPSAICNSTTFSYIPNSATPGVAYNWSRAAIAGISNSANSGTDDPNEILINTTADPIVVTYVYTLSASSCSRTQDVRVTVKPTPQLSSTLTATPVCNNSLFSYTPTSATTATTYAWSRAAVSGISNTAANGNDDPNETLINTTTDPVVVTYVYTLTANSCNNVQTVDVTVQPTPVLTSTLTAAPVCNNTLFSYVPASATAGTTFTWSRAAVSGISNTASAGNDDPNETLINTTADPIVVTYVYTLTANNCSNVQSVNVTVQPTPVLTSTLTAAPICNTTLFSYVPGSATAGTTYAWSRAVVSGISNAAANGNDDPNETLTNTTPDPVVVTYVYTLTANSCSNVQNVTVTVEPTPLLSSTLTPAAICNNTTFNYTPTSATTGTVYNWSRAAVTGIANTAAIGNDDPNEVLTNTTTDPIVVTYVYTLTANSCSHTENVTVTVNPTPVLTSTLTVTPVCDSSLFSYTPTSATLGTTYNWSRATVSGISNAANTGVDDPQEYLVNTTPDPVNVIYVYTLTANGCNNVQGVATTVYPKPLLSTTLTPAAICDSTLFTYTPASLTTGTTFVWSRAAVAGISNPANADNTDPVEVLDNTTTDPIAVTYVYTLTANGCSHTQNVVVVVDPTPVLTSTLTPAPVCDSTLFSYVPTSATAGTAYNWSRAAVAGISNASGAGIDDPMEYLVNTTPDPITVTYVYTLTANGCSHVQSVSVVVNPKPLLTTTLTPPAICDSTLFSYSPASATAGTVFTWSRAAVAGIANTASGGSNDPMEYLDNTTADPIIVVYIDTLLANGCYNTQAVSVVVNSTPMLSSALNAGSVCNNTTFNYTPTSATAGTTFAWTRAAVAGITNAAGSGTNNPAEILNNNTNHQVTVTYVYTLTANGCSNTQIVTMKVSPTPVLSGLTTATVCSSTPLIYTPGSSTTGATFAWSRAAVTGISNAAGNSTGTTGVINETLVNTTLFPVNVTYHYTLTAFGCSNSQNVIATVNPAPQAPVIAINSPSSVCSGTLYQNFGAANPPTDSVIYTWSATGAVVYGQGQSHTNSLVNFPTAGNADVILTANIHGIACYTADTFHVSVSSATALEPEVYYIHDHFICTDNTVDSYQWGYDDASTLDSTIYTGQVDQNFYQVSPDFTHKLYWVMTTKGGCASKSYYNAPTGVIQIGNSEIAAINVFPNPASNNVAVVADGLSMGKNTVELSDMTGKVIITAVLVNGKAELNVGHLASGIYFVSCYHNGVKAGTTKLVKD